MERREAKIDLREVEGALKRAAYTALHGTPEEHSGRFRAGKRRKASIAVARTKAQRKHSDRDSL